MNENRFVKKRFSPKIITLIFPHSIIWFMHIVIIFFLSVSLVYKENKQYLPSMNSVTFVSHLPLLWYQILNLAAYELELLVHYLLLVHYFVWVTSELLGENQLVLKNSHTIIHCISQSQKLFVATCLETTHLICLPPCSKPSKPLEKKCQLKELTEIFLSWFCYLWIFISGSDILQIFWVLIQASSSPHAEGSYCSFHIQD